MLRRSVLLLLAGCAACGAPRGAAPQGALSQETAPRGALSQAAPPQGAVPQAEGSCRLRIIASFDRAPDAALLEDLTRVSGARLTLVRPMPAGLYLMELAGTEQGDACSRALERLRRDERVRSADLDERREIAQ